MLTRDEHGRLVRRPGVAYLDGENSALCWSCADESDCEGEAPHFRPVSEYRTDDPEELCDQCSEPLVVFS